MTALATIAALAFGVVAFGESLGTSPVVVAVHLLAIAVVLACVPILAVAQSDMAEDVEEPTSPPPRNSRIDGAAM